MDEHSFISFAVLASLRFSFCVTRHAEDVIWNC